MQIRVLHEDGKYELVGHNSLDNHIAKGNVLLFKRSSGWIIVGVDPIRTTEQQFWGPDRRRDS